MWLKSGRRRVAFAALLAAALAVGCSKAAAVFLDLPEKQDVPANSTEAAAGSRVAVNSGTGQVAQGTVRDPLPIEETLEQDSVLDMLPKSPAGSIDWVTAIEEGIVEPRARPPGSDAPEPMSGFDFDFFLPGFNAYFPHSAHVEWLDCTSCHPSIFPKRGEPIGMAAVNEGEACGRCHGPVAFPATECERCHLEMGMPEGRLAPELLGDLVFARDTAKAATSAFPPARFSHWVHRIRYRCTACHPAPFELRTGATDVSMAAIQAGELCGVCHDGEAAFDLMACTRCHVADESPRNSMP